MVGSSSYPIECGPPHLLLTSADSKLHLVLSRCQNPLVRLTSGKRGVRQGIKSKRGACSDDHVDPTNCLILLSQNLTHPSRVYWVRIRKYGTRNAGNGGGLEAFFLVTGFAAKVLIRE